MRIYRSKPPLLLATENVSQTYNILIVDFHIYNIYLLSFINDYLMTFL
jgi:hypothetical protein